MTGGDADPQRPHGEEYQAEAGEAEEDSDEEGADPGTPTSQVERDATWALYRLLGIPKDATAEKIKKAYKLMALRWHPDKRAGDHEATRIFQQIVEA